MRINEATYEKLKTPLKVNGNLKPDLRYLNLENEESNYQLSLCLSLPCENSGKEQLKLTQCNLSTMHAICCTSYLWIYFLHNVTQFIASINFL